MCVRGVLGGACVRVCVVCMLCEKWKEAGDAFAEAAGAEVKRPMGVCVLSVVVRAWCPWCPWCPCVCVCVRGAGCVWCVCVCGAKKWKEAGDAFAEAAGAEVKRPVGVCVCARVCMYVCMCVLLWIGSFGIWC